MSGNFILGMALLFLGALAAHAGRDVLAAGLAVAGAVLVAAGDRAPRPGERQR